jgi:hypothetical protein
MSSFVSNLSSLRLSASIVSSSSSPSKGTQKHLSLSLCSVRVYVSKRGCYIGFLSHNYMFLLRNRWELKVFKISEAQRGLEEPLQTHSSRGHLPGQRSLQVQPPHPPCKLFSFFPFLPSTTLFFS